MIAVVELVEEFSQFISLLVAHQQPFEPGVRRHRAQHLVLLVEEDVDRMLDGDHETMKALRADAYDLVINGAEIGGGSIRIHDRALQQRNFDLLGFTREEAEEQFGFLMGAFEYGAPPHGGIAFGFDRLNAVMNGQSSIRDFIAFPKNTSGRDMMIDAPSRVDDSQLEELYLKKVAKEE